MHKVCVPHLVWLVLVLAGLSAAQDTPPADSGAAIRVTASEVLLDLDVRDKHGRHVKNLKPGDMEIYEDGVRQQILGFRYVGGRELRQRDEGNNGKQGRDSVASHPLRAVNVVCIVFHNLDPIGRKRAVDAVQEFIQNDLQPETYVGVFNLNDRLTAVHPFTNSRNELIQAARNAFNGRAMDFGRASEAVLSANPTQATISATVNNATHSANVTLQVTGGEISRTAITGAEVANDPSANVLRGDQVRERGDFSNITGMRETDKVITMINELGSLPGRKTILLVTTGLLTTGDPDRFASIVASANRLGVSIYALDTAGLNETSTAQAANNGVGRVASVSRTQASTNSDLSAMREKSRQADNMNDAVRSSDTQASLRALSEGTGGFLIANTNDFRKPFQHIIEDLDDHYEAAYRPTSDKYDGHLRKIEVKLARPDLHVESRTGYFAMPDLKGSRGLLPFEVTALAALNVRPLPHAFDFRAASFHFHNDGANTQRALVFELPGGVLTATPDPEHKTHRFRVSLLSLIKDSSGQIVDKYSLDAPYEIPDANLAAVQGGAMTYTHPVLLGPGHYTVETAVVDREGGRSSTSSIQMDSAEPHPGIGLSSLMLVQRLEPVSGQPDASDPFVFHGKRTVPMVAATLNSGTKPYVYFVVYPDKSNSAKPKIEVEFLAGGQTVGKQTADLPAPDASGAIPMFVGAGSRPGDCELRIAAVQGGESVRESVSYAVAK